MFSWVANQHIIIISKGSCALLGKSFLKVMHYNIALIHKKQLIALLTFLWKVMHYITLLLSYFVYVYTAGKISIEHVTIFPSK